jgi:signal transduction histidine kinase
MAWSTRLLRAALTLALLVSASVRGVHAQEAVLDAYQDAAGLTNMTALCLTQEARGTLWICTDNGLFRFDGFRIHREPLPAGAGTTILNALADRLGRLWVATDSGLYLRRESHDGPRWNRVTTTDGQRIDMAGGQSLAVDERGVLSAMEWENRLLTVTVPESTSQAVVAQRSAVPDFAPFQPTDDASSGPVGRVGDALWFGCGSGLCQWKDGQLKVWGAAQGLPSGSWSGLLAAQDGSLWARSSMRLAHLVQGSDRFEAIDAPAERRWAGSIALAQDPQGAIVTATDDGVARWDGRRWRAWTPREGLPETAVRALLFDAQGSLWLGTSGRGLHRWIGYGQVDHWTPASGLPSPVVTAFARAGDGRLWAATASGIASFDPAEHRFHPLRTPLAADGMVVGLAVDASGDLWWIQSGKLLALRAPDTVPRVMMDDPSPSYLVQGPHGIYIVSSRQAQALVPTSAGFRREPIAAALPQAEILSEVITDGTHDWFLTGRNAYRDDRGNWLPLRDERGAPLEIMRTAAFVDPSQLWAADSQGISVYAVHGDVAALTHRYESASFGGGVVLFIHADGAHRLWIGTDRGLFILEQGHWSHVDRTNGLLWNDIDENAFLLEPDGSAWIGTSAGATQLRPGTRQAAAPILQLDGLQIAGHAAYAAPTSPIAWDDRWMRVTIATPDIGRGRGVRVEYRLHDDEPWQSIDGNVIQLESLQPDSYVLQARAAAPLPIDEPGPALRIPFEIAPPWWATSPMKLGYVAALAALWYLSVLVLRRRAAATHQRLEQAIAQRTSELEQSREALRELGEYNARSLESERRRVSRELHDEMGQQLAALRMEVSVMRMRATASQPLGTGMLDTLLERVDGLVASVRTLVSQLRPPALDGGLLAAIEWLAAEFTRSTGVPCRLALDPAARELPAEAATMVFRIAQESFANVRRHAGASQVSVTLQPDAGRWALEVRDDGAGFDTTATHAGFGLLGMAERARTLAGELAITSAPGKGTTIRLEIDAAPAAL